MQFGNKKSSYLKTSHTDTSTVVTSDGEVLEQDIKNVRYLAATKEEFFLIYSSMLGVLSKLTLPQVRVYAFLLENYNIGSPIAITIGLKEIISIRQNIAVKTISNSLTGLVESRLLFKTAKGMYKLNPRYAFKGSTRDRNSMLKVILEVECPDC